MYTRASRFSILAAIVSLLAHAAAAAEFTPPRYIYEIFVEGAASTTHYFRAASAPSAAGPVGWGANGCPNAAYAYTRELEGQKDVLGVALSASALSKEVVFKGACDADLNYFRVTAIIVKP
jgi:hypothetical protein